jgi:hypothetical protein
MKTGRAFSRGKKVSKHKMFITWPLVISHLKNGHAFTILFGVTWFQNESSLLELFTKDHLEII